MKDSHQHFIALFHIIGNIPLISLLKFLPEGHAFKLYVCGVGLACKLYLLIMICVLLEARLEEKHEYKNMGIRVWSYMLSYGFRRIEL